MVFTVKFLGRKLLPTVGITAALVLGATACTDETSDTGTVVSITDGDTLVASVNGAEQTIRLLNIDTPETKDPNLPVECLGQEATEFLSQLIPVGSTITLKYDVERLDKYDRTLAAVYTPADEFVSAEIARAGLGTAVSFGKNTKYLPPVEEAERSAKSNGDGLHDTKVQCTLPAQIQAAATALDKAAAAGNPATAAAAGVAIRGTAAPIAAAKSVLAELKAGKTSTDLVKWAAFTEVELGLQVEQLSTNVEKAEASVAGLEKKRDVLAAAEQKAAEDAAAAEAKAAAETQAREEAAAAKEAAEAQALEEAAAAKAAEAAAAYAAEVQAQEEAYARAQAEAEAERIRNLPPVYVPPAPPVYVPPAPPVYEPPAQDSGGGYPGYTGPRCYLPGGKSYRPC